MRTTLFIWVFFFFAGCGKQPDWMEGAIHRDFQRYERRGVSRELLEKTWASCKKYKEFLRYQIIDGNVYGPESNIKYFLIEIAKRYPIPNVDFIYYNEDRIRKQFFKRKKHRQSAPIFVSAKEKNMDQVILFAEWNYDIRNEDEGWNFLIRKVNEEAFRWPWKKKVNKLFWRGKPWDTQHFGEYSFANFKKFPRGFLVAESRKFPQWIDAAFSEYPDRCKYDPVRSEKEMGPIKAVPWEEVFHYKYQIILDGVTCSFPAAHWKLFSGCLSFKQESKNIEYFYGELKPWVHYVPLKQDLSDLYLKLQWAKEHDEEARQIASNAKEFVLTHLMPEHILLYGYKALCKYATLQKFIPEKLDVDDPKSPPQLQGLYR